MTPFIRVTEFWLPTAERSELAYGGGFYGELEAFRAATEQVRFGYGEGLPGRAWAERRPIILKELTGSYFRRGEAARAAGLTCGVALPVFAGDFILAVVVFFCGGEHDHSGAIEAWRHDPAVSGQISLVDGYYGTADLFSRSSGSSLGKGNRLPGKAWEAGVPVFDPELYRATRLLRPSEKLPVGESQGIGIPFHGDPGRSWVMTFLSASGTPIAKRFDVWLAAEAGTRLRRDTPAGPDDAYRSGDLGHDDGLVGRILLTGLPVLTTDLAGDTPLAPRTIAGEALTSCLALPVPTSAGRLAAVACWYF